MTAIRFAYVKAIRFADLAQYLFSQTMPPSKVLAAGVAAVLGRSLPWDWAETRTRSLYNIHSACLARFAVDNSLNSCREAGRDPSSTVPLSFLLVRLRFLFVCRRIYWVYVYI